MAYEPKDLSGSLFKNDKEGGNPNWPDYKGDCVIGGQKYFISAWIKKREGKASFMSLSFQRPGEYSAKKKEKAEPEPFQDSELPF